MARHAAGSPRHRGARRSPGDGLTANSRLPDRTSGSQMMMRAKPEPHAAADAADSRPSGHSELGPVPGLVWAFQFHHNGAAEVLPVDRPIETPSEGWHWLHLDLAHVQAGQWLKSQDLPAAAVA